MRIETPRGRLIRQGNTSATLEWDANFQDRWQGQYNKAQVYVDSEVLRLSAPYIPFQSSMLNKSGILGTIPGRGEVVWNAPYAKFQYYGMVMIGEHSRSPFAKSGERKIKTGRPLTYHGAPKRGKLWFERMKADHKEQILRGARRIAGGRQ